MRPEDRARQKIDAMLGAAGWVLQDLSQTNLTAGLGVAIREFPLQGGLSADYALFVGGKAVGVIEAKPEGMTLSGVAEQSAAYLASFPSNLPHVQLPLRFAYESTGTETYFRDGNDPAPRSRPVFHFHKPETLAEWVAQVDTLRERLRALPGLDTHGLWECQIEAIRKLELSLAEDKPRALIQMATGSGKTFTAVNFIYRLIKFGGARRVLFLVDRRTLGKQTATEFQKFAIPHDGRAFTSVYNVQPLTSNSFDPVARVTICTIQRLYSMLRGEELEPDQEETSAFDLGVADDRPREVSYNPAFPIETFDVVVTDECHRSIYRLWRQVLEYFDAHLIGLTATPSLQTFGFFRQNLVMEYSHERAVADGVNVGYDVYRIKTKIGDGGGKVSAGLYVDKRSKLTRARRWEELDEDFEYAANQLDRDVVAEDQIRTVIRAFKDTLLPDMFPGRTHVPKTLIFAKSDSHAEDIVGIVREEFGAGNDFCKKITYRTTGESTDDLIKSFRNSYFPRIAVTVDMISTGTDVKPLECLLFMRDVRSRVYFDQMKGRGTRVVNTTDLQAVTPDAKNKTHFVIVDAVGVTETDKSDTRPLERNPTVSFDKLLLGVALGQREPDRLTSLAGRLARLDQEIAQKDREAVERESGTTLHEMAGRLLDAVDPDVQAARAQEMFGTAEPSEEQVEKAATQLAGEACEVFNNPDLRTLLVQAKTNAEQIIDITTIDVPTYVGPAKQVEEQARQTVESFRRFIEDNKDEITALQILYSRPHGARRLTYESVKQLAEAIERPPYRLTTADLWEAYRKLEESKVRGAGPQRLLTDIVSLVRFALEQEQELEPFPERVDYRFAAWLVKQEAAGRIFTDEQREWLAMIKAHIATSVSIEPDDLDFAPFHEKGGEVKARRVFGQDLPKILEELNEVLVA